MRKGQVLLIAMLVTAIIGVAAGMMEILRPPDPADASPPVGLVSPSPTADATRPVTPPASSATGSSATGSSATGSSATASPATASPLPAPSASASSRPASTATRAAATTPAAAPARKPAPKPIATKTRPSRTASGASGPGQGRIQYGHTYRGQATFYAADGGGNCSYEASADLMVGAMNQQDYDNSQSCGAYLGVTGPTGATITIKVVDRCPECPPGAIDLSREAFTKLAPPSKGLIQISWRLLSPALSSPVSYRYQEGSSQYWCGIQVRNHRNPIRTLELRIGTTWKQVPRLDYNYFVSESGAGCGGAIRITDIYGNRLMDSGITIQPGVTQRGHTQLPAR